METKQSFAPSLRGDSTGLSPARALSPAPSGRFSLRRVSLSSSRASTSCGSACGSTSSPITEDSSCVARETLFGDSARYRFITWAAIKRNECERMTPSERLECPLLRCRKRFGGHEAMLRHLAACDHLGTCEYWCYEHMRVERFDDAKCSKRCLGQASSKRRKMLVMAKSLFSSLGHKGRKGADSATLAGSDFGIGEVESLMFANDLPDVDPAAGAELSGTEILEIDSTELVSPPQPSTQATAPSVRPRQGQSPVVPHEVVDPQLLRLPELESTTEMAVDDSFMNWQPLDMTAGVDPAACSASLDSSAAWLDAAGVSPLGSPMRRLPLQANTWALPQFRKMPRTRPNPAPVVSRSKDLSPSSSVRSTTSTTSTTSMLSNTSTASATSNVSSLLSPASIWSHDSNFCESHCWSGFATHLTSPEEGLSSPAGFMPEDLTFEGAAPSFNENTCQLSGPLDTIFELPADMPDTRIVPNDLLSESMLFPQDATFSSEQHELYAPRLDIAEESLEAKTEPPQAGIHPTSILPPSSDSNMGPEKDSSSRKTAAKAVTRKRSKVPLSDSNALVGSAWDALLEHISSSLDKLRKVANNPLADQLRSLAPLRIAKSGLEAAQNLLDGNPPGSPIDLLCLIHVVYALSVVVYHDNDVAVRCSQLYVQSQVYSTVLSEQSSSFYSQLATVIWQPNEMSSTDLSQGLLRQYASIRRTPSQKGKERLAILSRHIPYQEDPLICTVRNFLDDLEYSAVLGPPAESLEVVSSALYAKHLDETSAKASPSITLTGAARSAITQLVKRFGSSEALVERMKDIFGRVSAGLITTVRKLELELLRAGKLHLPSPIYFDEFTSALGHICDRLYRHHAGGASQRATYHRDGVALLDAMFSELKSSHSTAAPFTQPPVSEDTLMPDDDFLESIRSCVVNGIAGGLMAPFDLDTTAMDLSGLHDTAGPLEFTEKTLQLVPGLEASGATDGKDVGAVRQSTSSPVASPSSSTAASSPPSESATDAPSSLTRIEANDCCDICGYRPKGDPQWFKGSMAKHKKLQHSAAPPKIYKCPFPGCPSQYKNRPDNLRQHQIEKGHFVEGEEPHRRPSKRKKMSD